MKLRKLGLIAIMGLGLFSLAACGSASNDSDPTNPSGQTAGEGEGQGDGSQGGNTPSGGEGQGGGQQGEGQGGGQQGGSTAPVITNTTDGVEISLVSGAQESMYAEFSPVTNATAYNVYYKSSQDSTYVKADAQLTRLYKEGNDYYYRSDVVGLKKGTYELKIVPVINNVEDASKASSANNLSVAEYDRSGFAFSTASPLGGKTVGAYNLDGTLKSNARVLYVTEDTKDKVSLDITVDNKGKTETATGVGEISQKMSKGFESRPLVLRLIGKVTQTGLTNNNDKLNLGFKEVYKNLSATQIANAGITIEGIGKDATLHGAGVRLLKSSNVEIRNLGLMYWPDDGIALESNNINIWVHNCDIFYGKPGSDSDQAKGDGSMDLKDDSGFITISYLHFWDSGKMSLCGMKDETGPNYITYHHNWFDHSDSRHPRIRTMSVHVYNNYFDGNSKYGVGVTTGADAFVEGNYFRNCKNPMMSSKSGTDALAAKGTFSGEEAGTIKAYNNYIEGAKSLVYANVNKGTAGATLDANSSSYDAILVNDRSETIASTYNAGGATYNNFDTIIDLGVTAAQIQTPDAAKQTVMQSAGRVQGGDFNWTFDNSVEDTNDEVISDLKTAIINYTSTLVTIQGVDGSSSSGSGNTDPTPTPTGTTVEDVIDLIDALPEATNVTKENKTAINTAKTAFDSLSSDQQLLVTNKSKLDECLAKLATFGESALLVFTGSQKVQTGDINFTLGGNSYKTDKGTYNYNGTNLTVAYKMDSNGTVSFTLTQAATVEYVVRCQDNASGKFEIKSGDNSISIQNTTSTITKYSINLEAGTYTFKRNDKEHYLYLIEIL